MSGITPTKLVVAGGLGNENGEISEPGNLHTLRFHVSGFFFS